MASDSASGVPDRPQCDCDQKDRQPTVVYPYTSYVCDTCGGLIP